MRRETQDDFERNRKIVQDRKNRASKLAKEQALAKLQEDVKKAIMTTMIASLDIFENEYGEIWGINEKNPTSKQVRERGIWASVRTEILDIGNDYIRKLQNNLSLYNIEYVGQETTVISTNK
jgi:hypothetical protein